MDKAGGRAGNDFGISDMDDSGELPEGLIPEGYDGAIPGEDLDQQGDVVAARRARRKAWRAAWGARVGYPTTRATRRLWHATHEIERAVNKEEDAE